MRGEWGAGLNNEEVSGEQGELISCPDSYLPTYAKITGGGGHRYLYYCVLYRSYYWEGTLQSPYLEHTRAMAKAAKMTTPGGGEIIREKVL